MGRSVSVPSNAVSTVYIHLDEPLDPDFGRDEFVDDLRIVIREHYPSFADDSKWVGREERSILRNDHARIVVAEYCGVVSVSLVPDDDYRAVMAESWCRSIALRWYTRVNAAYSNAMQKVCTMSNGESVFRMNEPPTAENNWHDTGNPRPSDPPIKPE